MRLGLLLCKGCVVCASAPLLQACWHVQPQVRHGWYQPLASHVLNEQQKQIPEGWCRRSSRCHIVVCCYPTLPVECSCVRTAWLVVSLDRCAVDPGISASDMGSAAGPLVIPGARGSSQAAQMAECQTEKIRAVRCALQSLVTPCCGNPCHAVHPDRPSERKPG